MSEETIIGRTKTPLTVTTLTKELQRCGMAEGQTVLVHMAMSKLGWVMGDAEAVILALLAAVGETGTIVTVTNSTGNSDPSGWQNPPIPKAWWQIYRDNRPAYHPQTSATRGMGIVPETFRSWPGAIRSTHPVYSLAASGANAAYLMSDHPLTAPFGDRSPVGKLYELDGHVLLLGVGHGNNTSLHHAEFRADFDGKQNTTEGCAMLVDGKREWVTYEMLDIDSADFDALGNAFDAAHDIPIEKIGDAEVRFFKQRPLVDFAVKWLEKNR